MKIKILEQRSLALPLNFEAIMRSHMKRSASRPIIAEVDEVCEIVSLTFTIVQDAVWDIQDHLL